MDKMGLGKQCSGLYFCLGAAIRILGGWRFLEINICIAKMGEINK